MMEHNYNWQFSDFFRQIVYASDLKNIYFNTSDAPFPPLTYCFFNILWKMNPIELPITLGSWRELACYQFNMLLFLMFLLIQIIVLLITIQKNLQEYEEKYIYIFALVIVFSAPFFAGAIERGNIALLVLDLLLLSLYLRNSKNKLKREFALMLIAIAAGIKIYPAIFGVLYIYEKRWKEAFRLIIYGMVFFFVPFIFTSGLSGLMQYLKVLTYFGNVSPKRWTSIRCFFAAVCQYLNWNIDAQFIGSMLEKIFLMLSIVMVFLSKKYWKRLLFLSGIMAVYVPNSYRYTSIYMLIPLVFLLQELYRDADTKNFMNYIYIILFATSFTIPVWAFKREVDFAIFCPIYLILLIGILENIAGYMKDRTTKNL